MPWRKRDQGVAATDDFGANPHRRNPVIEAHGIPGPRRLAVVIQQNQAR